MLRTVADTIAALPSSSSGELPVPAYTGPAIPGYRTGLAVESMRRHMTDEGWQLFQGLEHAGYTLRGHGINDNVTDVSRMGLLTSGTVVVQDKREWEGLTADRSQDPRMRFVNIDSLARRPDLFKVTLLKDAHQKPRYHAQSAEEMGCHAWIVYYHPKIVKHVSGFVRERHLIRTWHTIDRDLVPPFSGDRKGCLLSGALSVAYPLRQRLFKHASELKDTMILRHPGYHCRGCATPAYLKTLSKYKVAICTSSIYGYALRKIIEATVCGCRVITDLPKDEVLPEIDGNLIRVSPEATVAEVNQALTKAYDCWSHWTQLTYVEETKKRYDYRVEGTSLAQAIEDMRRGYGVY